VDQAPGEAETLVGSKESNQDPCFFIGRGLVETVEQALVLLQANDVLSGYIAARKRAHLR
jgi:hypothetical protein